MNKPTKNIFKALQLVIKEEVRKEVKKQVKGLLVEISKSKKIKPQSVNEPSYMKLSEELLEEDAPVKQYASDPILNKVLNETQGGISHDDSIPTMGGGAYTTDRMNELVPGTSRPPSADEVSTMPNFMQKAFSGHSAKVVKAIEKKQGTGR